MSRVTILVPNYNYGAYLGQCLRSIRAQTFEDWQAVVGDDGSQDDSVAIVGEVRDPRFRLVRRPQNIGMVPNLNHLLAETVADAGADYVAILDSDDWWEPGFLARLVDLLDRTPSALIATCAARVWSESGPTTIVGLHRIWPPENSIVCPSQDALRLLLRRNRIAAPGVVLARRELYRRFPRFEESLPNLSDWLMWLQAATVGDVVICPDILGNYRLHAANMSVHARRHNLVFEQFPRLARILESEWAGEQAPFPGAARQLAVFLTIRLLAEAYLRREQGESFGSTHLVRLARLIAPAGRWVALVGVADLAIRWSRPGLLRLARSRAVDGGRLVARTQSRQSRQRSFSTRHYLVGLLQELQDELTDGRSQILGKTTEAPPLRREG